MNSKPIHLLIGALTLGVFLLTGLYMKFNFPSVYESNEAIRYQFRANHIYILMIGLINVVTSLVPLPQGKNWRSKVYTLGSVFVMLAPLLLISAFFIEPVRAIPQRPLTLYGAILTGAGVVFLAISHLRKETFLRAGNG